MKKIIFTGLFALVIACAFSQEFKKARTYYDAKQLDKAKSEIDALLTKSPSDAMALYLKSKIYIALASNEQFKTLSPDPRKEAFDAFKKALTLDKGNILLLELTKDQYKPIFDLYSGYYDAGITAFNAGAANNDKAQFSNAFDYFVNADKVGNYIYTKKWALSELDTNLVFTIGKAALNAGKTAETIEYFKKLTDARIIATKEETKGYSLPYEWLTSHYLDVMLKDSSDSQKKEAESNFLKYNALGKQLFPKDDYYDASMIDYFRKKKDNEALFKKYAEIITLYPDSLSYHFNYANELFTYVYGQDEGKKINNKEEYLKTVGIELNKAVSLKPNDVNTNWLLGQYYFNSAIDTKEKALAIKGIKPDDLKKKADLNMQAKDLFTKAIPFTEKAITLLESAGYKKSDKSKYKSLTDLMQRIYRSLNQAEKIKLYQTKYDEADAKFKN